MKDRLQQNLSRIQAQGLLKFYVCAWNGVSEEYYNQNFTEFNTLKDNFYEGLTSAISVKLLTEEQARVLGVTIAVNEKTTQTTNTNTNDGTPDEVIQELQPQECPPPIIKDFYPLSGTTGKIIQINGSNLISTTGITVANIVVDMQTTQIFNNETIRFSVPTTTEPLPKTGKIKLTTVYGEVTTSVDFTVL
jgi:hypothetical protein